MSHHHEHHAGLSHTLSFLRALLPAHLHTPSVGIICGSGLGGLVGSMREVVRVSYSQIPGFKDSTVAGHEGALAFGRMGAVCVVVMVGRLHAYEGHTLKDVTYPVRTMAHLGITSIIITNAAGALNPRIDPGSIVVVHDHIALPTLTAFNPLLGPLLSPSHTRFIPLSAAYSPALRRLAFLSSHDLSLPPSLLTEGVYAWVCGPTYETPAEARLLRSAGADVVGMSTVPEVLVAREEGVEVLVLSLVTNAVVMMDGYRSVKEEVQDELMGRESVKPDMPTLKHEDVLQMGKEKGELMTKLVARIVERIGEEAQKREA